MTTILEERGISLISQKLLVKFKGNFVIGHACVSRKRGNHIVISYKKKRMDMRENGTLSQKKTLSLIAVMYDKVGAAEAAL